MVLHDLGVASGGDALGLVDVLEADGDAVQRPAIAAGGDLCLGGACGGACFVRQHADKAVELAVELFDAVEPALGQLDRRQLALFDQRRRLGDGEEIGDHRYFSGKAPEGKAPMGKATVCAGSAPTQRGFLTSRAISATYPTAPTSS